jgi:glycerol-3-phosphate acyltransferase PlsX
MIRIALDAMGGDKAPAAPVAGAWAALADFEDIEVVLVGDPAAIANVREGAPALTPGQAARVRIHDAPEVVGMGDDPVKVIRSSPRVSARACAELLRRGEVDGVVNMGSTGAAVAAATLYGRRLEGVRRLGIAVPFPRPGGVSVLVDGGANPDASAEELHQYAVMGTHYVRAAFGIQAPRVGILSIGEEEHKGNRLVHETWARFRASPIEGFLGNVEPRELFQDRADVVVCDGFVGNIALKGAEGMAEFVLGWLAPELERRRFEGTRDLLRGLAARIDYSQYGGAPLLGIDGGYVIGHGRSGPEAFRNGLRLVRTFVQGEVGPRIVADLKARHPAAGGAGS